MKKKILILCIFVLITYILSSAQVFADINWTTEMTSCHSFSDNGLDSWGVYNGTMEGGLQYVTTTLGQGKALEFDGSSNEWFEIPDHADDPWDNQAAITICKWDNVTENGNNMRAWHYNNIVSIWVDTGLGDEFKLRINANSNTEIAFGGNINYGAWHWNCFMWESGGNYSYYEDGVLWHTESNANAGLIDDVISTEPRIEVDWLVPARGRGNWRDVKDGDCWDRGKTNRIKLVGYNITKTVKWSFVTGEYVDIDPYWVVPTYGNVHFSMENFTVDGATLTGNWDSVDGTPTNFNIKNGEWVRPSCPT